MARIRTIKPEFFRSPTVETLTLEQRLTFIGLWTHVDDAGRCRYDPRLIKADVWPLSDRTVDDIESDVQALIDASLITHYVLTEDSLSPHGGLSEDSVRAHGGLSEPSYISVCGFNEHQVINRPTRSRVPGPERGVAVPVRSENDDTHGGLSEDSVRAHGGLTEDSVRAHGGLTAGKEGKGTSNVRDDQPLDEQPPEDDPGSRPDVDQLCEQLQTKITANGSKSPRITERWRTEARLLLDRDHRDLDEALELITWSQDHHFWRSNILSLPKFREKFDQLRLQRQQQRPNGDRRDHGTGRAVDISW